MISFDLKDGFHAAAVHPSCRKYLTFNLQGYGLVQLAVLPFGLHSSPTVFTKMMRTFVQTLRAPMAALETASNSCQPDHHRRRTILHRAGRRRRLTSRVRESCRSHNGWSQQQRTKQQELPARPSSSSSSQQPPAHRVLADLLPEFSEVMAVGLRVLPYVDDFLVLSRSHQRALQERSYVSTVLDLLGLVRNATKGVWEPAQSLEHLGLGVDTKNGIFFVTPERLQRVSSQAKAILCEASRNRGLVPRRRLAAFTGLTQSLYLALPPARHFLRSIHDVVALGQDDWRRRVRMSSSAKTDLQFFVDIPARNNGRQIRRSPHSVVLHTDASLTAWGAVLNFKGLARGFWRPHQRREHITLLEARALRYGVQSFVHELKGKRVLLWGDNQALVHSLVSWTSKSPHLFAHLRKLWYLLDFWDISIDPRHLLSAEKMAGGSSHTPAVQRLGNIIGRLQRARAALGSAHHRQVRLSELQRSAVLQQLLDGSAVSRGGRLLANRLGTTQQLLQPALGRAAASGAAAARERSRRSNGARSQLACSALVPGPPRTGIGFNGFSIVQEEKPHALSRQARQLRLRRINDLVGEGLPVGGRPRGQVLTSAAVSSLDVNIAPLLLHTYDTTFFTPRYARIKKMVSILSPLQ